ncbi:hypothetical protein ACFVJS_19195 [Nocardioides sp. NPDC057772]|uniref:hypothetical protein n=1 Tax=Nocardioides sp. NPDC057772 TaxID=3346245 RepID=UPI00366A9123
MDTEPWYFRAGARALAAIGVTLDQERYLRDMSQGLGTWEQARAAGLRSAVAAGIDCAVVHNDFTSTQEFSQATYRIDGLGELKHIVGA